MPRRPPDPEGLRRADRLFAAALEQPAAARDAFLRRACGGDRQLRHAVEDLLDAEHQMGTFLARPLFDTEHRPETPDDAGGRTLTGYRLVRPLASGAMGTVYLARRESTAPSHPEDLALKLCHPGVSRSTRARFRAESRILARLRHPHIARLLDHGETPDGRPFLVMEYVQGEPIDAYCASRQLSLRDRLRLMCQVCEAVQEAHRYLLVHRDIKPENVLVRRDGVPKLIDFGIAKRLHGSPLPAGSHTTRSGLRPMTPRYASPEQIRGEPLTIASDIYSLGVLLYRLSTGTLPYRLESPLFYELERAICEERPRKPSMVVGGARGRRLAGDLDTILLKTLRKEPRRRYGTASALADDLRRHLGHRPIQARPDGMVYRCGKLIRRHRVVSALLTGAALAILSLAIGLGLQARRTADERDQAAVALASFLDVLQTSDPARAATPSRTAADMLAAGAHKLRQRLADRPSLEADLLAEIAAIHLNMGLPDEALPLLSRSHTLRRQVWGDRHPKVADSLLRLAEALEARQDLHRASGLIRTALAWRIELLGPRHPLVAEARAQLGHVLQLAGHIADAEEQLSQAVEIQRQTLGEQHPEVATTLVALGSLHGLHGSLRQGESHLRRALGIRRSSLEPGQPKIAMVLDSLGIVMNRTNRLRQGEVFLRQALETWEASLPEWHDSLQAARVNLAANLARQGRRGEAEELFLTALDAHRSKDGGPRTLAVALNNYGMFLFFGGRLAEAESRFQEALASYPQQEAPLPMRAAMTANLAGCHLEQGQLAQAEDLFRRAIEWWESSGAWEHPMALRAFGGLAEVLRRRGDLEGSTRLFDRTAEIYRATLAREEPRVRPLVAELCPACAGRL